MIKGKSIVSDWGMKCIVNGNWAGLQIMDLGQNRITAKGTKYLTSFDFVNLIVFRFGNFQITQAATAQEMRP